MSPGTTWPSKDMQQHKGKKFKLMSCDFRSFHHGERKVQVRTWIAQFKSYFRQQPHGRAGQVLLPAFECIAAQLDSALATSGKKSEVLAFDLKLPFILPAKKPESRGESKWNFVFVKSVATSMTLWDTWQQIDTRSQKPGRAGLQEQTEQWQWLSYYSHLSMKPLSRARSPWWSMSLPFENASPQDQIVSRISDNTTKTSARALRTHHTNTYILTCVFPLSVHIADFCYWSPIQTSWVGCFASWLTIGIDGKASQETVSISFSFFDDQISLADAVCKRWWEPCKESSYTLSMHKAE